ncbi:hypothetical protein J7L68_06940 [bacterium]|nr:hypothetical protein [bacterium]
MKIFYFVSLIILIAIGLVFFAGCSKDNTPAETPDYFPLALGNSWTFEVIAPDSAGNDSFYTEVQTVDHTTTHDSLDWYVVLAVTDSSTDSSYYRKSEYFLESIFFYNGSILDDIIAVSPLDPSVGFTWSDTVNITVDGEVEAQEEITVPAGTFQCYREKIEVNALGGLISMTICNWLADGVGPARILYIMNGDTTDMKLTSYSVQ